MKLAEILLKTALITVLSSGGFCAALVAGESNQHIFAIGTNDFLLDGNKFQIRHDFGYVFIDGKRVGILDRRSASAKIVLPARA